MEQEITEAVVEIAAEASLHSIIGSHIAVVLTVIFSVIILYRFCRTFYEFIYTGQFGCMEECLLFYLIEKQEINKYALVGTHPLTIIVDGLIFMVIILASLLLWAPMLFISIILTAGYLLRKHIAKKQEFIARLDGTHEEKSNV